VRIQSNPYSAHRAGMSALWHDTDYLPEQRFETPIVKKTIDDMPLPAEHHQLPDGVADPEKVTAWPAVPVVGTVAAHDTVQLPPPTTIDAGSDGMSTPLLARFPVMTTRYWYEPAGTLGSTYVFWLPTGQ